MMLAPSTIACTTEWRDFAALGDIAEAWRALAHGAAEPNVFYEPGFALAAAPLFGRRAGAVLVWSDDRLIGFVPCVVDKQRIGLPLLTGWTHPYAPLGTPLFERADLLPAVSAFLDHVADNDALPKLVLLPYFGEGGPVAAAFDVALAQRGARQKKFGAHLRALLAPARRDGYFRTALNARRRKKLKAQRERLADNGGLAFDIATASAAVETSLTDFLALEASGWKGARGSAAACDPATRGFVEQAVTVLAGEGKASIGRLVHAGRTIASGILLRSGHGAWFWKVAYDEAFASSSPGVQITLDLSESVLHDPDISWCDSCATPDHAMIDHLWRERRALADRLISVNGGSLAFPLACRLESARRAAIGFAKKLRDRLRRR